MRIATHFYYEAIEADFHRSALWLFLWRRFIMSVYLKDKRLQNAVVEVVKENSVLDKQVINCLLESIYETANQSLIEENKE